MSSLVQSVVTDVIASHQRLQQQQQQQQQQSEASGSALLDSNNNAGSDFSKEKSKQNEPVTTRSRGEKYSLRPRSFQRRSESDGDSDNAGSSSTRSGSRRGSGSGSRSKQKAPPLSKYRRKTANARERDRMREINAAFETLRRAVPHVVSPSRSHHQQESSEKLTKITTLRLAMRYITALSQALQQQQQQQPSSSLPQHDPLSEFFGRRLFSPEIQETVRQDFPSSSINNLTLQNLTSSDLRQHQRTLENPNQTISKPLNYQGLSSSEFSQQTISPLQINPLCTNVHSPGHKGLLSPGILQTDTSRCMNSGNLHAPRLSTSVPDKMTMSPSSLTSDHLSMQSAIVPPVLSSTSPSGITQHTMVPGLCMSTPILGSSCLVTAPDISPHCLAPVDFEEHSVEEHSSLLAATVFDDESLDSPDLDHLLIS